MDFAKTARNLAVADVALAFARDRLAAQLPGVQPRKRRRGKKALLIGGVATAAAAAVLLKRDKVTALLPGRTDEPAPPEPAYTPPPVSNYDAAGPVANTATSVPVPPAYEEPTIDEAAEEAAAAAEAGNIGGTVSDYAGPEGELADARGGAAGRGRRGRGRGPGAGRGSSCARPPRIASEGLSPEQAQIEEAIDQAANPLASEQVEPTSRPTTPSGARGPGARRTRRLRRVAPASRAFGAGTRASPPNLTRARARIGHNTQQHMSTLVGMQLSGRYRLDAQIGAGGMSTVYKAFDVNLERRVAIKLLHREMSADSDQLERFRREARAVAQLSHPHIVGVIDAGEDENRPYIVFEYVEGETLKDRIRRLGRLPIDESLAYAIEIARALGCAHAHEIVHRDVKPQNVLLDPEGSAKVTDFGIARSLRDDGLTADGRVLGTTDYVSPEQALGHDVDGQSDIYSLGVVLYEMLTGDVPFHGENQISVAMKHVREDLPDIQRVRPEVSATTAAVLDRMTDKDLAHRYADVPSLIADLEDALALEAARQGTSTGEATAVIRTLPAKARRRLPFRMRHSLPILGVIGADRASPS